MMEDILLGQGLRTGKVYFSLLTSRFHGESHHHVNNDYFDSLPRAPRARCEDFLAIMLCRKTADDDVIDDE